MPIDALVGQDLDVDPVAAAGADQEGLDVGDLHGGRVADLAAVERLQARLPCCRLRDSRGGPIPTAAPARRQLRLPPSPVVKRKCLLFINLLSTPTLS